MAQIAGTKTLPVVPITACAAITAQKEGVNASSKAATLSATIPAATSARFDRIWSTTAPIGACVATPAKPASVDAKDRFEQDVTCAGRSASRRARRASSLATATAADRHSDEARRRHRADADRIRSPERDTAARGVAGYPAGVARRVRRDDMRDLRTEETAHERDGCGGLEQQRQSGPALLGISIHATDGSTVHDDVGLTDLLPLVSLFSGHRLSRHRGHARLRRCFTTRGRQKEAPRHSGR